MTIPPLLTIGARITWLREKKNMKKSELARAIGIRAQSMGDIESGKTKAPASSTLLRIAAILDANPDWIINYRGHPTNKSEDGNLAAEMAKVMSELSHDQQATLLAVAKSLRN